MIDLLFIQGETAETTVAVQTEAPAVRQAEVIEVESKPRTCSRHLREAAGRSG